MAKAPLAQYFSDLSNGVETVVGEKNSVANSLASLLSSASGASRRALATAFATLAASWLPAAPAYAAPTAGTIYVSGASPSALPAGNDTTGDGSASAPYATLTKALSVIGTGGNKLVLCDGTFAENTTASGRWILAGLFRLPVVFDSYSGSAANFIISNVSGTSGVVNIRSSSVSNIQFRRATIRPTTDACSAILFNPATAGISATNLMFFDCNIEVRSTASTSTYAIALITDYNANNIQFVRCSFVRTAGASTATNPSILQAAPTTLTTNNQPYSKIGLWNCSTSDNNWMRFSGLVSGISGLDIIGCTFSINGLYGILLGQDSSGGTTPKVTNGRIWGNTVTTVGSNPHAILVGENAVADVDKNVINSTLQGIVIKGSIGSTVNENIVTLTNAGVGSALYSKASFDTVFTKNVVSISGTGSAAGFREANDGSNKAGRTTFSGNTISVSGASAAALVWADGTGSVGGAVSNDNTIILNSGATLGFVRGISVSTLAALQAAWAASGLSDDVATNDSRSTLN